MSDTKTLCPLWRVDRVAETSLEATAIIQVRADPRGDMPGKGEEGMSLGETDKCKAGERAEARVKCRRRVEFRSHESHRRCSFLPSSQLFFP